MKTWAVLVLVVLLGACSQNPSSVGGSPYLRPAFGSSKGPESAEGLAPYGNGVYVAGWADSPLYSQRLGGRDAFLAKYDKAGNLVWGRQFGSAGHDSALDVATDTSGNVYIGGVYNAPNPGISTNLMVRKYSAGGALLWSRQTSAPIGSTFGGIAVSGNAVYRAFTSITSSTRDAMLQKYSLSGTLLWSVTLGASTEVGDIAVDANGNVYATGIDYYETGDISQPNRSSVFTRKFSPAGLNLWEREYSYDLDIYYTITPVAISVSGIDVYVANHVLPNNDAEYSHVLKYTTGGSYAWDRFYREYIRLPKDISANSSGAVFAGTEAQCNCVFVTRIRPDSSIVWNREHYNDREIDENGLYTRRETIGAALLHPDNTNFFMAGSRSGSNQGDALLARMSLLKGSIIWTR